MAQREHAIPENRHSLICNHNLFDISAKNAQDEVLAGILNSTFVVLSKFQFGRPVGVEGNLKTEVVDVNMMLVPNPQVATKRTLGRVSTAFRKLAKRKALQFLSEQRLRRMAYTQANRGDELETLSDLCELDMDDRRQLDDAVLEMMGVKSKKRRTELINALYDHLRTFFENTRVKEEKAIVNKNLSRRRGRLKPADVASQIFEEIQSSETWLLQQYDTEFLDKDEPFDSYDIPDTGIPRQSSDLFAGSGLSFVKGKKQNTGHVKTKHKGQDDLIVLLVEEGYRGLIRVPHVAKECTRVHTEYAKFVEKRDAKVRELVAERTSDDDLQEKIFLAIKERIANA